jgi:hypothetical protein
MNFNDLVKLFDLPVRVQKTLKKVKTYAEENADDYFSEDDIASDLYGAVAESIKTKKVVQCNGVAVYVSENGLFLVLPSGVVI